VYRHGGEQVLVIRGAQLEVFEQSGGFIPGKFKLAVPVYVVSDERRIVTRRTAKANKCRSFATGHWRQRREFVRWPGNGKLPENL
jgi:hypothetical protein